MSQMTFEETMAELEKMGTAQNVKIYKRHGAGDNLFGVSFANLKILKKKIKIDQELARQLWATKNTDAQTLAAMIADPEQMDKTMVDNWLRDIRYYTLVDVFVGDVVSKTGFAREKMEQWTQSDDEWIGRAGWQLIAHLAMSDDSFEDSYFERYLPIIESNIHNSKNRTKEAMNSALIAIGIRSDHLEKLALETETKRRKKNRAKV